ncbi:hypothetical protein F4Z99_19255 [Candidatus Poribacteria bacterium]|nr:hypothetical protein [Candidatus Poribacteria bacterium]
MRKNPEMEKAKIEIKKAKGIAKYSVDYDMTIVIRYSFLILGMFLFYLFVLEICTRFILDEKNEGYLTPEIIHTIFGFIGGVVTTIVTFLAKRLADQKSPANGDEKAPHIQEEGQK